MYPKLMCDDKPLAEYNEELRAIVYRLAVPEWLKPLLEIEGGVSFPRFYEWIKGRIVPKGRVGIKEILHSMGLENYYPMEIAQVTKAFLMEDPYWIAFNEEDEKEAYKLSPRALAGIPPIW